MTVPEPEPMTKYDWLLAYSEWLDADQHLLDATQDDERTHDELVREFLDWFRQLWHDNQEGTDDEDPTEP